jgi:ribonucleoside-diphosphate reductase alpha chain
MASATKKTPAKTTSKTGAPNRKGTTPSTYTGMKWSRSFSREGEDPFHTNYLGGNIEYERRTALIEDTSRGEVIFRQDDVEVPTNWSQNATNILASKYFYGDQDIPEERETSMKDVVGRVARFIANRGHDQGYFASRKDSERFGDDLVVLMTNQVSIFNSPTLFNAGIFDEYGVESGGKGHFRWDEGLASVVELQEGESYKYPQPSACFILGAKDNMNAITELAKQMAMLFKGGSGAGVDLSTLRSSYENLTGGGSPSGPMSFAKIYDVIGECVKSGGKTRRAAEMLSLLAEHPNILEFIVAKARQEELAHHLIEAGVDGSFGGEAYSSISFQNANLSVRATDAFMNAVVNDDPWKVIPVKNKELADKINEKLKYQASDLMDKIAEGTHICGDPGMQYHTTINKWHTCKADGEIMASNPCSEYMFLNDSACNLASLNLMKFRNDDGSIDTENLSQAARITLLAQEILVDPASYPSEKIAQNSHDYRPLGLGYANLGGLLMSLGIAYDSDKGRAIAGAITANLTGEAYKMSSEIAARRGAFAHFDDNAESMLEVIAMHQGAVEGISDEELGEHSALKETARVAWSQAISGGRKHGYRNAQVTVLAPTGTTGFVMDCDTTGIEPDIALVKHKNLSGGGMMKISNQLVPMAAKQLGYGDAQIEDIIEYISEHDTIEGAPHLQDEHLPVFDCAFKPANGVRSIHYMGHLRMMAAAQPFISGAISKTVNVPEETVVAEIRQTYIDAWQMGLKAVAIYRDNSKKTQPLNTRNGKGGLVGRLDGTPPKRLKLAQTRPSAIHKFEIGTGEGTHGSYFHMGMFEDGSIGEIFFDSGDEGSEVRGMADAWATAMSLLFQVGYPLKSLVDKFGKMSFPPSGMLLNGGEKGMLDDDARGPMYATSIVSYVMGHLGSKFLDDEGLETSYKPYTQLGLFGDNKKGTQQGNTQKPGDDSKTNTEDGEEISGTNEELLARVNTECPTCHGPGIKTGKCDVLCLGAHGLVRGTCGGS